MKFQIIEDIEKYLSTMNWLRMFWGFLEFFFMFLTFLKNHIFFQRITLNMHS